MSKLNFRIVAASLAVSAALAYLICVVFQPIFPDWAMYTSDSWEAAFPGFSWSFAGILIGLVESALYGLLAAVIFVPVYTFFSARFSSRGVS
ncbi:MAG TPA: DUF5676 family membrane protein [Anaerolineales bacterium]